MISIEEISKQVEQRAWDKSTHDVFEEGKEASVGGYSRVDSVKGIGNYARKGNEGQKMDCLRSHCKDLGLHFELYEKPIDFK